MKYKLSAVRCAINCPAKVFNIGFQNYITHYKVKKVGNNKVEKKVAARRPFFYVVKNVIIRR